MVAVSESKEETGIGGSLGERTRLSAAGIRGRAPPSKPQWTGTSRSHWSHARDKTWAQAKSRAPRKSRCFCREGKALKMPGKEGVRGLRAERERGDANLIQKHPPSTSGKWLARYLGPMAQPNWHIRLTITRGLGIRHLMKSSDIRSKSGRKEERGKEGRRR